MLTYALLGSTVILLAVVNYWKDGLRKLPGPWGLPVIGNSFQIRTLRQFLLFTEWAKHYGHIFRLNLFGSKVIVLNSFESVYAALVTKGHEFSGRPESYRISFLKNNSAIGFIDPSPKRRRLRKIASSCIKAYGPGLGRIERLSQEITEDFVTEFSKASEVPVDAKPIISNAVAKMMCLIILGEKFDDGSDVYSSIRHILSFTNVLLVPSAENQRLDNFPWLRHFGNAVYKKMQECKAIQSVLFPRLKNLCLTCDPEDRDAVPIGHALYGSLEKGEVVEGSPITELDVQPTILELLLAGITTTTNTFYSLLNILIHHPDIQEKIQAEIDEVLGQRQVTLADKDKLPYCFATIYETLRYASNVANDIPHKAIQDTELCGYHIPKGTPVFLNLWSVHHDEKFWGDPDTFRPERFLQEDGTFVRPDDPKRRRVLAFGAGPRVCIGEGLAKARMLIWLVSIMQRFHLKADPDRPLVSCDPKTYEPGLVLLTPTYYMLFVPRE